MKQKYPIRVSYSHNVSSQQQHALIYGYSGQAVLWASQHSRPYSVRVRLNHLVDPKLVVLWEADKKWLTEDRFVSFKKQ